MINIIEKQSIKSVGKTSLFIYFDYNPKIVEIIKSYNNCIYHKNLKAWESPISNLSSLIDTLTFMDNLSLEFLQEDNELSEEISQKFKTEMFN